MDTRMPMDRPPEEDCNDLLKERYTKEYIEDYVSKLRHAGSLLQNRIQFWDTGGISSQSQQAMEALVILCQLKRNSKGTLRGEARARKWGSFLPSYSRSPSVWDIHEFRRKDLAFTRHRRIKHNLR
ncbi:uncharacterized protein BDR25DRAFT_317848 [Lindgomyces ingoldianus]|uniref:Uncharacterized protein n=1 Tax=Lindgomyces ingoldianus TaxID=673940 RepID=A0ACB6QIZ3_9PLEO|nr:uncharacterized protein BDR25DRAFT_317848 [Lindgomyces ingoldianus]KAF2466480.1 hypothetical protein BDR25DRAFT_317848 [Lindgomyces ingoldianus]